MMPTQRRPWASLLAVVLFLSAFDLHAPGEAIDSLAHSHSESYSSSARHPGQPAHLEASQDSTHPVCPLCLHRLRTSGAHLTAVAVLEPLARQGSRAQNPTPHSGHGVRGPSGARAPPSV
jgi:hypothetical protein